MRILLADEDNALSDFVREGLGQERFIVDVAHDGNAAYEMATEGEHDAILLDIVMPNLSGYEILRKLRAQGRDVPILIITSKNKEHDKLQGFNNGADDYITKPFQLPEVIARIRAILRRVSANGSHGVILRIGKLELNLLRREFKCSGRPVYLTKVEFDLLEYFMRRPGEVISQSALKQHVFGDESNLNSNALPVHILNLRSKIGSQHGTSLIRTFRGCGYALDV